MGRKEALGTFQPGFRSSLYFVPIVQAIYYILLLRPSPFLGLLDFYVLVPFSKLIQRRYQVADLTLRDRLGSGNFGQVTIAHCSHICAI